MLPKRLFNLLIGLLPLVYLIHNSEEWFAFNRNVGSFVKFSPKFISDLIARDPVKISSIFGVALIYASIIPLVVAFILWNKVTNLNIKVLLMIAFVTFITFINALSHITSSFALGFISPGLITGLLICIPYSIAIFYFIKKYDRFTLRTYLILGIGSFVVYALGLGLSWFIGVLTFSFSFYGTIY